MSTWDQECVRWRKSSYSGAGSNCVEVALAGKMVGVRDTKDRDNTVLEVSAARWADFLRTLR